MRYTYWNEENKTYYPDMKTCASADGNYRKKIHTKLGQLEDIEEELGIDLVTLFKALKNGIVLAKSLIEVDVDLNDIRFGELSYSLNSEDTYYIYLKDYGKTWALTKEELI